MQDSHKPSKSSIKRDLRAVHALGEELVGVPEATLDGLSIDPDTLAAVRAARSMSRGARKRQLRFLAGLLARAETATLRRELDAAKRPSAAAVARFHAAEQWRDRLLDDASNLDAFITAHPHADRSIITAQLADATAERAAGRPPRAARQLFRLLREVLDGVD